ncbi:MAG: RluA family pseudouridine synthase [Treponema sp.]|nr:RluA family pseudouridine synthase [Treponema sp.]MCL2272176.1 RluA family pseudouridine synthase [Treponema sp.]
MELIAGENDNNRRLDRILRKALPSSPLSLLHRLLRQGKVLVNGKSAKADKHVFSGDKISIPIPEDTVEPAPNTNLPSAVDVLWQDSNLLAVNKPSGLYVHGNDSLDTMVRSFLADKISSSLSFKSGPLHRLDRPSSGIVVFSKTLEGARLFSSLLKERKIRKTYLFIAEGNVEKEAVWENFLVRDREKKRTFVSKAGKNAVTKIKTLSSASGFSFVIAEIITGRTHQIRAQSASHGYPLAGDRKYGSQKKGVFLLHAWKMEFLDVKIEAALPQVFRKKINELRLSEGIIF